MNLENRVEIYYKYLKKKDLIWLKPKVKSLGISLAMLGRVMLKIYPSRS
ncbi:MAG: hypothetical protein H3Z53_00635 [archaeon]|nr:hypothetical protein [archaeon]